MYIKGLKERVVEAKKYPICSLEYRNIVFDIFKTVYPTIMTKYGESWISKEDFLEYLFLEVHSAPTDNWPFLFYKSQQPRIEPIVLNDEMKEECDFALFQYQDDFQWVDLNEWLEDFGWYNTETDQEVDVSDLNNEEILLVIKEWQDDLEKSEDRDDALMLFLLESELNRRLARC